MADIAIAHEHYYERGGGEHVAEELARTFDTDIYTGFVNEGTTPDDITVNDLFGHGLVGEVIRRNSLPAIFARDAYYQFAWQNVPELHEKDIVVQSGNNPGWFVPRDDQVVIKYVHSPPRNPYDQFHRNAGDSKILQLYAKAARQLYRANLAYPDVYVANSDLVKRRIVRYWGIPESEIEVVYPPVDTNSYGPEYARTDEEYYLTFSRLTPEKRIDEIIQAANQTGIKLIVGGSGPEREYLESIAEGNVEFVGYMSEDEKRQRLAEAKALIFNAENEDFGLVPIEAMASGTPVIGVRDGFTKQQIIDGENGYSFSREGGHLRERIRHFERHPVAWSPNEIRQFAVEQFDLGVFQTRMREIVENAVDTMEETLTPEWKKEDSHAEVEDTPKALADGGKDE